MSNGYDGMEMEKVKVVDRSLKRIREMLSKRVDRARRSMEGTPDDQKKLARLKDLQVELEAFDTLVITCYTLGEEVKALRDVLEGFMDCEDEEREHQVDAFQAHQQQQSKLKN